MKTMKAIKMMLIAVMMMIVTSASAMSYSQAKDQALFLADKMAYELKLTDEQYEAAYEINLDYLMAVNNYKNSNRTIIIQNNRTVNIQNNRAVGQTRSSMTHNRTFGSRQTNANAKTITNNGNTNSIFGRR